MDEDRRKISLVQGRPDRRRLGMCTFPLPSIDVLSLMRQISLGLCAGLMVTGSLVAPMQVILN